MEEFKSLEVAAGRGGKQVVMELLKHIRTKKIRRPDVVLEYGVDLIQDNAGIGDERWTVMEQVFQAALDLNNNDIAQFCIKALKVQFPSSNRVQRLVGLQHEAKGEFSAAESLYKNMLAETPTNTLVFKRLVACQVAQGKKAGAIRALNAYLNDFPADAVAWQQLGDLHCAVSNYEAAAFCYEELVLTQPSNCLFHLRLAELYYTLGSVGSAPALEGVSGGGGGGSSAQVQQLVLARKHFSRALELQRSNNPRALMGLAMACAALSGGKSTKSTASSSSAASDADLNGALHQMAAGELKKLYKKARPEVAAAASAVLDGQSKIMK
eukprot:CAMPEP_0113935588 /NCGR_PEP_ID=MMETSP1339-20121228/2720_1 /TAXON_ID=94617 /ORGANISM="Fibrocapsa japonica" /LENGTH=324 /DNA_ID=CAMNT_0000937799 /DNA_START=18 /DNA_END=992 /DNA_ORIENTATION=- /assembly_acc=CAM_ASM_000762